MNQPSGMQQALITLLSVALFVLLGTPILKGVQARNGEPLSTVRKDGQTSPIPGHKPKPPRDAELTPAPFEYEVTSYEVSDNPAFPKDGAPFINIPLADAAVLGRAGLMNGLMDKLLDEKEERGEAVSPTVWAMQEEVGQAWQKGDFLTVSTKLQQILRELSGDPQAPDSILAAMYADDSIVEFIETYVPDQDDKLKNRCEQATDLLKEDFGEQYEKLASPNPLALDVLMQAKAAFDAEDYGTAYRDIREFFTLHTGDPFGWEAYEARAAKEGKMRMDVMGRGDLFLGGIARLEALGTSGEFQEQLTRARTTYQSGEFPTAYAELSRALSAPPAHLESHAAGVEEMLFESSLGDILTAMTTLQGTMDAIMAEATSFGDEALVQQRVVALRSAIRLFMAGHVEDSVADLNSLKKAIEAG